jgi:protocatechuate 3,4-dioxygenase, beta subunit
MKTPLFPIALALFFCVALHSYSQQTHVQVVGGPCEGCEAVLEFGSRKLHAVDTLPDFNQHGPKLKLTGTIFLPDGKTPARGVILYIYHTDHTGVYPTRGDEKG